MIFHITEPYNGNFEYKKVWNNFSKHVDESFTSSYGKIEYRKKLLSEYGARLLPTLDGDTVLWFNTDEHLSVFLLKFS